MKLLVVIFALFATPALATDAAQILGCHKQSCSQPRNDVAKPKKVGPKGFCPQHRDGYCRTVHEFWEAHQLRS
jgi:hypothetical protein